ncbi:MAG: hypothetical protein ACK5XN_07965 [Bacteroidota bacterium]|jgi:hypothetical protein
MKSLTLQEIIETDNDALSYKIECWKEYDAKTVLLCYGELKRRDFKWFESLSRFIASFCSANSQSDIDIYLKNTLNAMGYNSFEDLYEKEMNSSETSSPLQNIHKPGVSSQGMINFQDNKYPALKTVSLIQKIFGFVLLFISLVVSLVAFQQGVPQLGLLALVLGFFFSLIVFAISESIIVLIDIEKNTRRK